MSLLVFLSYALKSYVDAHLVPGFPGHSNTLGISVRVIAPSTPEFKCPETRSLWDILWGCLVTIFACTWASIHPNIPDKDEVFIGSIFRRMKLMVYAFLVPDVVILWAIRQRIAASRLTFQLAEEFKYKIPDDHNEWTIKHSFFLQMGGFVLYEDGQLQYTILPENFRKLLDENRIDFPRVHEKDIADRSKGDFFSKGVVLIQTTWFIVQCIARWVRGLGLNELEVLTLALAVLNGVIYVLWFHKPLNVQWHVRVDLKTNNRRYSTNETEIPMDLEPKDSIGEGVVLKDPRSACAEDNNEPIIALPHPPQATRPDDTTSYLAQHLVWLKNKPRDALSMIFNSTFIKTYRKRVEKHGLFLCILRYLMKYPFVAILKPITDMTIRFYDEHQPKRAPMFYADTKAIDDAIGDFRRMAFFGGIAIGPVFGAIHCTAWSFQFPSHIELLLWRISAVFVTASPVAFCGAGLIAWVIVRLPKTLKVIKRSLGILASSIVVLSLLLYIIARMTLLVLALISLRSIPTNSLSQIDWVSFIPHV